MSFDTIFALSTGTLPSGIAIVRLSGPGVRFAFETMVGFVPDHRKFILADITDGRGDLLDRGLVVYFQGPNSFTGEECGEFHIHGSRAVLASVLSTLGGFKNFRLADAGEFSRRAFENDRLDLTEIEGLSDLIKANTDRQRILALQESSGSLRLLYGAWRDKLIRLRAHIEAELDFIEEEDIPEDLNIDIIQGIESLAAEISSHLTTAKGGEIIKDGFRVSLIGPPNSGKSSLINALSQRDVAIVSDIAGTTRDVISVNLNLSGFEVIISDTAGIHDSDDIVEQLGIDRAIDNSRTADLSIILQSFDASDEKIDSLIGIAGGDTLAVFSKCDLAVGSEDLDRGFCISSKTGYGLPALEDFIVRKILNAVGKVDGIYVSKLRHKLLLENTLDHLVKLLAVNFGSLELVSEDLRFAGDQLGRIVGKIDVEDLLDSIFSEFCVGK